MTREQKQLLKRHAEHFSAMASYVRESSDGDLVELYGACLAASETNCGWDTYAAAQYLAKEVRSERTQRARRRDEQSAAVAQHDANCAIYGTSPPGKCDCGADESQFVQPRT